MVDFQESGDWLLVDAAGPAIVTGLVRNGDWLAWEAGEGEALEHIAQGCRRLLEAQSLSLPGLDGCLYACGPGSTLGLRLAALFLRGLMELPALSHWTCLCYNNLALACAALYTEGNRNSPSLAAPWRRDRCHLARMDPGKPASFRMEAAGKETVSNQSIQMVALGKRLPADNGERPLLPYPVEKIPATLRAFPELLVACGQPRPYTAEDPDFVKWSPKRHGAR